MTDLSNHRMSEFKNNSENLFENLSEDDNALIIKKIEQARAQLERGEGRDWDEFKAEWLAEEESNAPPAIDNSITQ